MLVLLADHQGHLLLVRLYFRSIDLFRWIVTSFCTKKYLSCDHYSMYAHISLFDKYNTLS